ncbi:hypothetical protein MHU86_17914 [Fragilaria crotonensis]|nr:hypothetical protein MHU86_17914 [Fragilaria crotonensis]
MDVDEATLEFYMKQGFYTPNTPNDLRVQLQTALDMLELLTCDGTIAGKGLAYILEPRRWSQLTTVLNDRFKSEKDFGAKFCYALDRHLQTFFNKVTRWEDIATEGQSRYLANKAEELVERLEDGQGLNVVLPTALASTSTPDKTKRAGNVAANDKAPKKKKPATPGAGAAAKDDVSHPNTDPVATWLPAGTDYLDLFGTKMPGLKVASAPGHTHLEAAEQDTEGTHVCPVSVNRKVPAELLPGPHHCPRHARGRPGDSHSPL